MNRPIKFRQWAQNKFYYWGVGVDDNTFVGPASGGSINATNTKHQQFTGLIDRNGKEIWEGDVVRNWQGGWNVVVYKAPTFEATVSAEQSSSYSQEWWAAVEVIGNVYEHLHLLEPPC